MQQGIVFTLLCSALFSLGAPLKIGTPKVEHQVSPAIVGTTPRFSWYLLSEESAKRQKAYQIIAASSEELLIEEKADLWNSGFSASARHHLVPWGGKELKEGQTVFWKVRVKDEIESVGEWSEVARFQCGEGNTSSKAARISGFESSSEVLNKIYQDSVAELGGRLDRFIAGDETALGSGAEVQRAAREYLYHFDAVPHLMTWLRMMDAQRTEEGFFPIHPGAKSYGSVSSDAGLTVSYPVWWMSGDDDFVKDRWPIFEKYMQAREKIDPKFRGAKWGEEPQVDGAVAEFADLCYLGYTNRFMRELASPAREPLNVIRYKDYAARIRVAFAEQYLDEKGAMKLDSQTALLLALRSAVLPEDRKGIKIPENQDLVLGQLRSSLAEKGAQVGPVGAHFLLPVLALTGQQTEAVKILHSLTDEQRAPFIGAGTTEWMMGYLAGIDGAGPGFQQIRITPNIPTDDSVKWVKAYYDSASGRVSVRWEKLQDKGLKIEVTIPPGTLSRMLFPKLKGQTITESGKLLDDVPGVEVGQESDTLIALISHSGKYVFEIK